MTVRRGLQFVADVDPDGLLRRLAAVKREVTVVVTVYNGGQMLRRCFDALLRHTRPEVRIIVINDCSTDETTLRILDELDASTRIEVVHNPKNRGYTRTANHGLYLSEPHDVVLLNSDAIVGPMWLQRLRWVAYYQAAVGTVSAVSDDAAANSIPRRHQYNSWYPRLSWDTTSRLVARGAKVWSQEAPSAHGFCMYLRREVIKEAGPFDREAFPVGYGEEVDFSIKARQAGWRNVVAPHVMVKHLRSGSFGARRAALNASGKEILARRYPSFRQEVSEWETSVETAVVEVSSSRLRTSWKGGEVGPLGARFTRSQRHKVTLARPVGPVDPFADGPGVESVSESELRSDLRKLVTNLAVKHGVENVDGVAPEVGRTAEVLGLWHPRDESVGRQPAVMTPLADN